MRVRARGCNHLAGNLGLLTQTQDNREDIPGSRRMETQLIDRPGPALQGCRRKNRARLNVGSPRRKDSLMMGGGTGRRRRRGGQGGGRRDGIASGREESCGLVSRLFYLTAPCDILVGLDKA